MTKSTLTMTLILLPGIVFAADGSNDTPAPMNRTVTVALQGGFTNTFQLVLGGMFGKGADWQDRLTVSVNNAFRRGDSLSAFGWSTTDLPTATPNWQTGLLYKSRIFKRERQELSLTGGAQRWVLPSVKTGAKDWLFSGNLTYVRRAGPVAITGSTDSWTVVKSTLPTGSVIYNQVYTMNRLFKHKTFQLSFKEGPAYTYAFGVYGANGSRVFRYTGALVANWKGTTIEGGCRQQFGLQTGIKDNRYWSILVTRQFTWPFGS